MNILIASAGRRVKIIEYFKKELGSVGGKVIAVDCDEKAPALYFADAYEIVPKITDKDYIQKLLEICKKHNVNALLSLIDPELSILSFHRDEFEKENISLIVSDYPIVETFLDKYKTYTILKDLNIPHVKSYLNLEEVKADLLRSQLDFPLIVKPRNGSASIDIHVVSDQDELFRYCQQSNEYIIQPFISGEEYGVDTYVDLISGKLTDIFIKKKIKMRSGETDKSISIIDPKLTELIKKLHSKIKLIGPIDIDCFKINDEYVISEVNPRFGGGYPHAYESGVNFISNIINNLNGTINKENLVNYKSGTVMLKFDHVYILDR